MFLVFLQKTYKTNTISRKNNAKSSPSSMLERKKKGISEIKLSANLAEE